jgi:hypothetical protein
VKFDSVDKSAVSGILTLMIHAARKERLIT